MSFATGSFSSVTGTAAPNAPPATPPLTKMSPGTVAELREKYSEPRSLLLAMYDGPCSSSALFGPSGAHASRCGSLHPLCRVKRVK
jgi:hypothetical protein